MKYTNENADDEFRSKKNEKVNVKQKSWGWAIMRKSTSFRNFFQHHNDSNITAEIQIVWAHISCFQFVSVLPFFIPNWPHDKFSHSSHTEKKQVQEAKLLWEGVVKMFHWFNIKWAGRGPMFLSRMEEEAAWSTCTVQHTYTHTGRGGLTQWSTKHTQASSFRCALFAKTNRADILLVGSKWMHWVTFQLTCFGGP